MTLTSFLCAGLAAVTSVDALSASTASVDARAGTTAFERLSRARVTSVATSESVVLTDRWRNGSNNPFFGLDLPTDERCVVELLRHFG